MNETQAIVAIVAGTLTSAGVVLGALYWMIRTTLYIPLASRLDRALTLIASHTHDDDGAVSAPIVNGGRR